MGTKSVDTVSSFGEKIIYQVSLTCQGTILPSTKYIILHKCFIHENQSFSRSCEIIHQNLVLHRIPLTIIFIPYNFRRAGHICAILL